MKLLVMGESGATAVSEMSFHQAKQAAALMDCIGRLIPQEGVDYDVEILFKGAYDPKLSINIIPLTDKGEWWKRYVSEMIRKYPPSVSNPEEAIQDGKGGEDEEGVP